MKKIVSIALILGLACLVWAGSGHQSKGVHKVNMAVGVDTTAGGNSYGTWTTGIVGNMKPYSAVIGRFIIHPSANVLHDLGESDSAFGSFYTEKRGVATALSYDTCADLPCTCLYAAALNDTLFGNNLYFITTVRDTVNDTAFTAEYKLEYDVIVRGR